MIKIRKNVFETNSSSTHSLCIAHNYEELPIDESIFLKSYNITPLSDVLVFKSCKATYISIEDKLTYFLSIICMKLNCVFFDRDNFSNDTIDEFSTAGQFYLLLKEIFPNTKFNMPSNYEDACNKHMTYSFEDGDYLLDDPYYSDRLPHIQPLLNKENLKRFMQYGTIYFYNRDEYSKEDVIDSDLSILVSVSG